MDWIEEKNEQLSAYLRNLSFRKALIGYIVILGIITVVLSAITMRMCFRWQLLIWQEYDQSGGPWPSFYGNIQSAIAMSQKDETAMEVFDFVRAWCPLIYGFGGMILTIFIFYKKRLMAPFTILQAGTEEIQKNNLDFPMHYESKDELGQLCESFEKMRLELIHNKEEMYQLIESQKKLNAAFAHDLRTPLTVLKGYSDFLSRYIPEGKVGQEKTVDTLKLMSAQLERLEHYSRTMKGIRSIEEMPVEKESLALKRLVKEVEQIIFSLNQIGDIQILCKKGAREVLDIALFVDKNIVLEVLENLLSNAIRYAVKMIEVELVYQKEVEELVVLIRDDGAGFSKEELKKAILPYYREPGQPEAEHFGIGLHICSQLCKRHGGALSIANSVTDGAAVTASFFCGGIKDSFSNS